MKFKRNVIYDMHAYVQDFGLQVLMKFALYACRSFAISQIQYQKLQNTHLVENYFQTFFTVI